MAKKLTQQSAAQAKASAKRREVRDGQCPGLYLAIHPTGAKAWVVRFRSPIERDKEGQRKAKKLTLGPFTDGHTGDKPQIGRPLTLVQARALATAALEEVQNGIDPTQTRREEKTKTRDEAISQSKNTVDAAIIIFLHRYKGPNNRGIRESTQRLTAHLLGLKPDPENSDRWSANGSGVLKRWSGRPLATITKRDVRDLVEALDDAGTHVTANRTLAALKTFFKFCANRDLVTVSPAEEVTKPAAEKSRERVLSDTELAALWRVADADGYAFGRLVQLLILTGARRDELREAPWAEFDLDAGLWKLPAGRSKNGKEHHVPLSGKVVEILHDMPRPGGLLFTTTGDTPFSGLSRAKRRIDEALEKELGAEPEGWTLHDLRRTAATGMAQKCGVPPHIIEAALNHISGIAKRGVAGIYNRATYTDEIRKALQAWADYVDCLVNDRAPVGANVVHLHEARQ